MWRASIWRNNGESNGCLPCNYKRVKYIVNKGNLHFLHLLKMKVLFLCLRECCVKTLHRDSIDSAK